jgi:hypothetical protein
MNERIQELYGNALDKAVPYTWHNLDHVEVEKIVKEFAELILKECLSYMNDADGDIDYVKFLISRNFGVEE